MSESSEFFYPQNKHFNKKKGHKAILEFKQNQNNSQTIKKK